MLVEADKDDSWDTERLDRSEEEKRIAIGIGGD